MCTNVQPEFRLLIMFDYDSIGFGKHMTNILWLQLTFLFLVFLLGAFDFRLLNFVFYVLCFGFCVSCVRLSFFVFHVLYFHLYVRLSATKKNKEKEC